jgi:hypothetical protein
MIDFYLNGYRKGSNKIAPNVFNAYNRTAVNTPTVMSYKIGCDGGI